jgi:hypothetical protein
LDNVNDGQSGRLLIRAPGIMLSRPDRLMRHSFEIFRTQTQDSANLLRPSVTKATQSQTSSRFRVCRLDKVNPQK